MVSELLEGVLFQEEQCEPLGDVAHFLEGLLKVSTVGVAARIAQCLGVTKSSVHGWIHRSHLPTLTQIIDLAETFGCSIHSVLTGEMCAVRIANTSRSHLERHSHRFARSQDVRGNLEAILQEEIGELEPPSLAKVARQLSVDRSHLRKTHPELAKAIVQRRALWIARNAINRHATRRTAIRETAFRLAQSGVVPTRRRIAGLLPNMPIFSPIDKQACEEVCQEITSQDRFARDLSD